MDDAVPNRVQNLLLGPLVETIGGIPNFLGVAERLEELGFFLDVVELNRLVVEELPDRAAFDQHHVVFACRRVPAGAELVRNLVRGVLGSDLRVLGEEVVVDADDLEDVGAAIGRYLVIHACDRGTATYANEIAFPERRLGKLPKELLATPAVRLLLLELAESGEATLVLVLVSEFETTVPLGVLLAVWKSDFDPRTVDVHPRLEAEVAEPSVMDLGEAENGRLRSIGARVVAPFPIFLRDRDGDFVADFHQFVYHVGLLRAISVKMCEF